MKLLRTIRLDPSDMFVFERAAEPGEWAVSGAFMFWSVDPETLAGKARSAFRGGFLGVQSLGWSTLVQIVDAREEDRSFAVETLAQHLVDRLGAPDLAAARAAAAEEVAFSASLCVHPVDALVAVHRACEEGAVREAYRTLHPRGDAKPLRAFSFLEVDGENEPTDEQVDLVALAERSRQ